MPRFKVRKGQDAYVYYDAIVEASDKEDAYHIANSWRTPPDWVPTGYGEFDHYDIFAEEVEEVAEDYTLEPSTLLEFSPEERACIASSLRLWQRTPEEARLPDGETGQALTPEDIDRLCARFL